MSKYKIGQTIVRVDDSAVFEEAEIVAQHSDGKWILEVTKALPVGHSHGRLLSRGECALDEYYKIKQEFFQVGRTYRFSDGTTPFRYEVTELFLNEHPVADQKKLQALAIAHKEGRSHRRLLDESDFECMVEVK